MIQHLLFDLNVCCQLYVHHLISVYLLSGNLETAEEMKSVIDSRNYSEIFIPQSLRLGNNFLLKWL